jgi:hypothetical protein
LFNIYPHLRIKYIEKNQNEFLKKFNELEIEDEEIAFVLKSHEIKLNTKYELLKIIEPGLIIENHKIASEASEILANSPYVPLTFEQLDIMFRFNFKWESKIKLLIMHFDNLEIDEIKSLTERLTTNKYYSKLFRSKNRPTFGKSTLNENLFSKLKAKGLIKRFDENPKNKDEFRVIANY